MITEITEGELYSYGASDSTRTGSGRIYVVYLQRSGEGGYAVFYRFSDDNGETWSANTSLSGGWTDHRQGISIVVDSQNNVYVAISRGYAYSLRIIKYDNIQEQWGEWRTISLPGISYYGVQVDLCIDSNDRIYLLAMEGDENSIPVDAFVIYSDDSTVSWSFPERLLGYLSSLSEDTIGLHLEIEVGLDNVVHIFLSVAEINIVFGTIDSTVLCHLSGMPNNFTLKLVSSFDQGVTYIYLNMVVNSGGTLFLCYTKRDVDGDDSQEFYVAKNSGDSWGNTLIAAVALYGITDLRGGISINSTFLNELMVFYYDRSDDLPIGILLESLDSGNSWQEYERIDFQEWLSYLNHSFPIQTYPSFVKQINNDYYGFVSVYKLDIYTVNKIFWVGGEVVFRGARYTFTPKTKKNKFMPKILNIKDFNNSIEV